MHYHVTCEINLVKGTMLVTELILVKGTMLVTEMESGTWGFIMNGNQSFRATNHFRLDTMLVMELKGTMVFTEIESVVYYTNDNQLDCFTFLLIGSLLV